MSTLLLSVLFVAHKFSFGIPIGSASQSPEFLREYNKNQSISSTTISSSTLSRSAWVEAPNRRGTYELLLSCLTTLFLCAWTAFHPNIPSKQSVWKSIVRRIKWMIIAVVAPEMLLYIAWSQFINARRLMEEVNKNEKVSISAQCPLNVDTRLELWAKSSHSPLKGGIQRLKTWPLTKDIGDALSKDGISHSSKTLTQWTMSQAFFAYGGGIAARSKTFYPSRVRHWTFTPQGVVLLAKLGLLPDISTEVINDQSKANFFSKIIVCVQAGWFVTQSIARVCQKLPLTLLEIHTLIHIGCALTMYAIWFQKPYDISVPYYCTDERVIDLAALFSLQPFDDNFNFTGWDLQCSCSHSISVDQVRSSHRSYGEKPYSWVTLFVQDLGRDFSECFAELPIDEKLVGHHWERANRAISSLKERELHFCWKDYDASQNKILGRNVGFGGIDYVVASQHDIAAYGDLEEAGVHAQFKNLNWRSESESTGPNRRTKFKSNAFIVVCAAYGGAHAAAWYSHFPTTVEMWLWRGAGIALAATPFMFYVQVHVVYAFDCWLSDRSKDQDPGTFYRVCRLLFAIPNILWLVATSCVMTAFAAGRLYIPVEAFISLRSPAPGTYKTEQFSQWLLHAG